MAMMVPISVPLIRSVATDGTTQAWFADDAASGGKPSQIRQFWDRLLAYGSQYRYSPSPAKAALITKNDKFHDAEVVVKDTGFTISSANHHYLGEAIGSESFLETFTQAKIAEWA